MRSDVLPSITSYANGKPSVVITSYDAADATTADDGVNCVHDAALRRFKLKTTVVSGAAAIAFTDGDTARRVTVTNSLVSATSRILATVRRPDSANDSADLGYLYTVAIVRQFAGSGPRQ